MSGEKTEQPTEQRKKKARRDGTVASTPDLGSWGGLLVATMLVPMVVRNMVERGQHLLVKLGPVIRDPSPERALALLRTGAWDGAVAVAPLCAAVMVAAIAASAAQTGLRPAFSLLKPKFSRLNPLPGTKRMFGGHAAWEATKALAKTAVLGVVLYLSVRALVPLLLTTGSIPLLTLVGKTTSAALGILRTAAVAGLVFAVADYLVARRRVGKQIRMTKQEVKEEHRSSEGDPQLRAAIRGKQLAMGRQRMMAEVPKADVVVVNPTHVAVALRYDPARGAPRVIAKGAGSVAAKIREKAAEHRIPMVQDTPLARALYRDCNLGDEIPPHFYEAVARVLAFVMSLKARGSAAGLHRVLPGAHTR